MKKYLYCIVGETGAGKDTVTDRLCRELNYRKVVSFTDAPIRSDQKDGREHWFLTKDGFTTMMEQSNVIAYTKIGDNRYMATLEQLDNRTRFYIIDPDGVRDLKKRCGDKVKMTVFYLYVPEEVRRMRTKDRQNFDFERRRASEKLQFDTFMKNAEWDVAVENIDLDETVKTIANAIRTIEAEEDTVRVHLVGTGRSCDMPIKDFLELQASQYGYDSYASMLADGLHYGDWTKEKCEKEKVL